MPGYREGARGGLRRVLLICAFAIQASREEAVDTLTYPASLEGYWQGTMQLSRNGTRAHESSKVELVFGYGRRIAPPDTSIPIASRQAVMWDTLSSEPMDSRSGRFCEVLSFNSHARVEVQSGSPGNGTVRARLLVRPGVVCGIFQLTGEELVIAWASEGNRQYPTEFNPSPATQVARLRRLTTDVYPAELEGQWSGVRLLTANDTETSVDTEVIAITRTANASSRTQRCKVYSGGTQDT